MEEVWERPVELRLHARQCSITTGSFWIGHLTAACGRGFCFIISDEQEQM